MYLKKEFESLLDTLSAERDLIKSKLQQASVEVNKEFSVVEKQWQNLKDKMAEIADETQENSQELLEAVKLDTERLKQRYHELSQQLSSKATSTQAELETAVEELRVERDEIKLQMHLASMEVQQAFEPTENLWQTLKVKAENLADATQETTGVLVADAKIVADELSIAYQHIKRRLSK